MCFVNVETILCAYLCMWESNFSRSIGWCKRIADGKVWIEIGPY